MEPLQEYIAESTSLIETRLNELVSEANTPYRSLFRAARYTLFSPSKRLRPILAIATAEALGAELSSSIDPACALELVHTYSLIHDDLPCMDNAPFRRGKASLHTVVPEGQAVLAGNYLLTYAFDVISQAPHLHASQRLNLIQSLASRSGSHGLIGGQVIDLALEGQKPDLDVLQTLAAMKTGALFTASLEFGGIIAEAPPETLLTLQTIGEAIGLAFQMVDDVLDASSDRLAERPSFIALLGLDKTIEALHRLEMTAKRAIDTLPGRHERLHQLVHLITRRESRQK
ncbi:MAG: polyprenyl synthetase family protein [Verrucomicrobia bacterium]|nr:polyprenyl synthetase family protein [Verrucomicrobiota bacterium]